MTVKDKARALADVHAGEILASVEIATPIEQLFDALTNPDILPKWWGHSDVYTTESMTADLRVGGAWRCEGRGADGSAFHVGGVYTAIDRPRRLEFTWLPSWEGEQETTVRYALDPIDGGTRLTLRHLGFGGREAACLDHTSGWEMVLGWLERFLSPKAEATTYFAKLMPPRPSFAMDATASELEVMKRHGEYWRERMAAGNVIVFGPVGDPQGPWGLIVLRAESEQLLHDWQSNDPAILSEFGFRYESLPMIQAVTPS